MMTKLIMIIIPLRLLSSTLWEDKCGKRDNDIKGN
jgi:hypothetical protein